MTETQELTVEREGFWRSRDDADDWWVGFLVGISLFMILVASVVFGVVYNHASVQHHREDRIERQIRVQACQSIEDETLRNSCLAEAGK